MASIDITNLSIFVEGPSIIYQTTDNNRSLPSNIGLTTNISLTPNLNLTSLYQQEITSRKALKTLKQITFMCAICKTLYLKNSTGILYCNECKGFVCKRCDCSKHHIDINDIINFDSKKTSSKPKKSKNESFPINNFPSEVLNISPEGVSNMSDVIIGKNTINNKKKKLKQKAKKGLLKDSDASKSDFNGSPSGNHDDDSGSEMGNSDGEGMNKGIRHTGEKSYLDGNMEGATHSGLEGAVDHSIGAFGSDPAGSSGDGELGVSNVNSEGAYCDNTDGTDLSTNEQPILPLSLIDASASAGAMTASQLAKNSMAIFKDSAVSNFLLKPFNKSIAPNEEILEGLTNLDEGTNGWAQVTSSSNKNHKKNSLQHLSTSQSNKILTSSGISNNVPTSSIGGNSGLGNSKKPNFIGKKSVPGMKATVSTFEVIIS